MGRRHFFDRIWQNPAKGTTTLFASGMATPPSFLLVIIILLFGSLYCFGGKKADSTELDSKHLSVHGFIKSDVWLDSRQTANARDGLFLLYPLKPQTNDQGFDINENPSFGISAITSRINVSIIPQSDALQDKVSGFIEADFSGVSNQDIGEFRLRHAYINWSPGKNDNVLFGYYWHPFFVTDVFPSVLALNTGAPFQPFIRSPQIRYRKTLSNIEILATILTQMDYLSDGPDGRSYRYVSNSPLPNLNFRVALTKKCWLLGGAIDFKTLRPQLDNMAGGDKTLLKSISGMVYTKYQADRFTLKAKYILGENLNDHLLLGGYIVNFDSTLSIINNIRNTRHHFLWLNPTFGLGNNWDIGLFAGYAKRLNIEINENDVIYARGQDLDHCYRLSLQVCKRSGSILLSTEIEGTVAAYGDIAFEEKTLQNIKEVTNMRLQFSAFLFF